MSARLSRTARGAAILTAAAALVVTGNASAANAAAQRGRATVKVHVSSSHHVTAPGSLHPGLVHVVNTASRALILVRKNHTGRSGFVTYYNKATNTAGSIKFYKHFDVVDVIASHADEYVRLVKGTYFLAPNDISTIKSAQVHTLTVSGKKTDATAPHSTLVQAAANGHVTGAVSLATRSFARVVNKTGTPHIISIESIRPNATSKQVQAAIADPAHHDPSRLFGNHFAPLGLIAEHTDIYKRVVAKAGRYFLFAASLTHPGLAKGQIGLLTVK
jgi:hypothetical protein